MTKKSIKVAEVFTRYPAGRYLADGPFSGEKFRQEFLVPALKAGECVTIDLDGTRGYGSSFLEEAFGGLVRLGYEPSTIMLTFDVQSSDESLIDEIKDYVAHGAEMPSE